MKLQILRVKKQLKIIHFHVIHPTITEQSPCGWQAGRACHPHFEGETEAQREGTTHPRPCPSREVGTGIYLPASSLLACPSLAFLAVGRWPSMAGAPFTVDRANTSGPGFSLEGGSA